MSALLLALYVGAPVILLILGFAVGKTVELTHVRSLELRESALAYIAWSNTRKLPTDWRVNESALVQGQAVIGSDHFKTFASGIRNLFGGRHRSLETIMERARHEALIRMLAEDEKMEAQAVWNVRIETSNIAFGGGNGKGLIAAEIYAYGTALRLDRGFGPAPSMQSTGQPH